MLIQREAARAILLTPQHEVLLLRIRRPHTNQRFWITPGGGLEPGETVQEGLRRELYEELGIDHFSLGPVIYWAQHTFFWDDKHICQRQQYLVVHTRRFEPQICDQEEAEYLEQCRWWEIQELLDCKDNLSPPTLPQIVSDYLQHGPPNRPLNLEIFED